MNLLLRLIWMFLTARFGAARDSMGENRMTFRCLPTDLDVNMHMTNSRYHSFTDLVRIDLVIRSGAWKRLRAEKLYPVLASATMRFRRSIAPFQKFIVTARVVSWDEKWIYIEHRFLTGPAAQDVAAISVVKTTFLSPQGRIPIERLIAIMGYTGAKPDFVPALQKLNELETQLSA
ncbi:MAG: thioesterase family protein [Rhodospirillaceae bacterium]|nr:thioesterase family protein [Rhodospirillaceae bacterium]